VVGAFGVAVLSQLRVQAFARGSVLDQGLKSNRFVVERTEKAKRGDILSADGKPLATAEETSELGSFFQKSRTAQLSLWILARRAGSPQRK
jgi:hypothetical protein